MAATHDQPPTFRCESPSPDNSPVPALGACPELTRCLSTASSVSYGSSTDAASRDSFGSDLSRLSSTTTGYNPSRRSDASFASSRQSTCSSLDGASSSSHRRRRGYMRPQGTDFAASARSRDSVMSLGSIAHLQYYFARTGLLDGKGAQLARKNKQQAHQQQHGATLDMSVLGSTTTQSPKILGVDVDSSYGSMSGSPLVESPTDHDVAYDFGDYDEPDPNMLPPTASTYIHRETPVTKPPTIGELKAELTTALHDAAKALAEAKQQKAENPDPNTDAVGVTASGSPKENSQGWYELQGMHMLDVMTLAIRAAKLYYTSHEYPDRLDAIKAEREVRAELLAVMETLKHMGTRGFAGGMRDDEMRGMAGWVDSVFDMLRREEELAAAEAAERASWTWLSDGNDGERWRGREAERELSFMASMDTEAEPLPPFISAAAVPDDQLPTEFLREMRNGLRLVRLHNAAVRRSRRRFGAIPSFHVDTAKPYRCADNLRYWVKAAELRWEVLLHVDALGVVYDSGPQAWRGFEVAIMAWCRRVREEITAEVEAADALA